MSCLFPYLPDLRSLRAQISAPTTQYDALQAAASEIRARIGLGERAQSVTLVLLDTNAYLRLAKRVRPVVGIKFGQKGSGS